MQDNAFAGSIPVGSSNTFLHVFRARNNYFTGTVPDELWELPQLLTVDISNNRCVQHLYVNDGRMTVVHLLSY